MFSAEQSPLYCWVYHSIHFLADRLLFIVELIDFHLLSGSIAVTDVKSTPLHVTYRVFSGRGLPCNPVPLEILSIPVWIEISCPKTSPVCITRGESDVLMGVSKVL